MGSSLMYMNDENGSMSVYGLYKVEENTSEELTNGVLYLYGNFTQLGGDDTLSFTASDAHLTIFKGINNSVWFNKLISTALKSSLTTITEENVGGNELRLARTDYYVRKTVIEKIADT
jgi:hypothetical protein